MLGADVRYILRYNWMGTAPQGDDQTSAVWGVEVDLARSALSRRIEPPTVLPYFYKEVKCGRKAWSMAKTTIEIPDEWLPTTNS